jgi:phosphatidate cytidylyltransferase
MNFHQDFDIVVNGYHKVISVRNNNMFLQRLITTLILVPLIIFMLFYANPWVLGVLLLIVYGAAIQEYWQLIPLKSNVIKIVYGMLLLVGCWACGLLFPYWLVVGLIIWVLLLIAILSFPLSQVLWGYPFVVGSIGVLILPLFIQSMIHVYFMPQGKALLLYLFCLVWAADIGAYITGKRWGAHRLIRRVSPGKSWEGVLGGFSLALLVALCAYFYFIPAHGKTWFILAIFITIISIVGDLLMSMLKRRCHVKDTGSLIPGHGGVLDRLDSLIAALPLFCFIIGSVDISLA